MRNLVQVFGLPRSGTNFLEWTLNNNFVDVNYKNIFINKPPKRIPVKHTLPNLDYSDYALIIYKDKNRWEKSMKKDRKDFKSWPSYESFLKQANTLPEDKTIIVKHKWAYDNYFELLDIIQKKTNLKLVPDPTKPVGYFNKGGANATYSDKHVYKL